VALRNRIFIHSAIFRSRTPQVYRRTLVDIEGAVVINQVKSAAMIVNAVFTAVAARLL
jgi:hypothetical protein